VTPPESIPPQIPVSTLLRIFGSSVASLAYQLFEPTEIADGTMPIAPEVQDTISDMTINPVEMPSPAPYEADYFDPETLTDTPLPIEIPYGTHGDGFTIQRSPRAKRVILDVPDIVIAPPVRFDPDPSLDIWSDEGIDGVISDLDTIPLEVPPLVDTESITLKRPKLRQMDDVGLTITLDTRLDLDTGVETESIILTQSKTKASTKRRKDVKVNRRWIKAAHKLINITYGTYSEFRDFLEVFVWNIRYRKKDGTWGYAMSLERGSVQGALRGLREGRYELDMGQLIIDFAMTQLQDYVIGRASQLSTRAIDEGIWRSPTGPSSFANRINVL
jgi:hypothetical protein